jgi:hypothetical protein
LVLFLLIPQWLARVIKVPFLCLVYKPTMFYCRFLILWTSLCPYVKWFILVTVVVIQCWWLIYVLLWFYSVLCVGCLFHGALPLRRSHHLFHQRHHPQGSWRWISPHATTTSIENVHMCIFCIVYLAPYSCHPQDLPNRNYCFLELYSQENRWFLFFFFWETTAVVTTLVIAWSEIPGKLPGCSCCHAGVRVMKEGKFKFGWLNFPVLIIKQFNCLVFTEAIFLNIRVRLSWWITGIM